MNKEIHNSSTDAITDRTQFLLFLDNSSFVPYYEQIASQVRKLIYEKQLNSGQMFWSEGEIARRLGISKMPVRQAFQKLRAEGLLMVAKGKRPVIGGGQVPWDFQELHGFSEEMRRRGLVPSAQVLVKSLEEPSPEVARALRLNPGDLVFLLKRLRFVNEEPVAVVTSYLPVKVFPGIDQYDFSKLSLYHVMEGIYRRYLRRAEESIGATVAEEEDAAILKTVPASPLLLIKETTYDVQLTPIEYSISLLRADRYMATVISVRKK